MLSSLLAGKVISIHAPSRERRQVLFCRPAGRRHFNPRSLAGATKMIIGKAYDGQISIHAPSRERRSLKMLKIYLALISIHAPSRERLRRRNAGRGRERFQSTLPRGSDSIKTNYFSIHLNQAFFAN